MRATGLRLATSLLAIAFCLSASAPSAHAKKRVLMISIDGVPFSTLQNEWHRTPNLRELARRGAWGSALTIFPSMTWPSHTSIVTGCLPAKHGVVGNRWYDASRGKSLLTRRTARAAAPPLRTRATAPSRTAAGPESPQHPVQGCRREPPILACTTPTDATCVPCPQGANFSDGLSLGPCVACAECAPDAFVVSECTSASDTVCACDTGYSGVDIGARGEPGPASMAQPTTERAGPS